MATLDWAIIGLYFILLVMIVRWVLKHKKDDTSDYFLSGRGETWLAVGAGIFGANIGSEHLVGLAGAGASSGMAMAHWEMQGWMILILGWVFVPFYAHSMVFTMPEFLKRRFNRNASSTLSLITLIGYVITKVSVAAYTGGIFLEAVFGIKTIDGVDFFWIAAIGTVIITGIFTIVGGMKSILLISVIQTPILIVGAFLILILGLYKLGQGHMVQGWANMVQSAGDKMHLIHTNPNDPLYKQFPGVSVIFGAAIIGFWYWVTDQAIVQRVLSAKNMHQARTGSIFAGYLKLLPVFMFLIPGIIAAALRARGDLMFVGDDKAYGSLVAFLLPIGIKGIVVVGFLAALMTSLAATYNSAATLYTIDFYKPSHPQASEKKLVIVGRVATLIVVILGVVWIPIMRDLGDVLYEYLQKVQSLIAPAIAAVFILGVFSRKITPKAGEWGLIIGFVIGMFRLLLMILKPASFQWFLDINWLNFSIFLFFFTMALMIIISLFTKKPGEENLQGLTYFSQTPDQRLETRTSWTKWDILNSVIIVGLCVAFYIYFW